MEPIFLLDTRGNANPLEDQENPVVYKRDFFILNQNKFEACDDLENCKIEFFGLKLDSKDIDNAVKDMHICKKKITSQVEKNLHCQAEKASNSFEKSCRKQVSDFTNSSGVDENMRQKNMENNMNSTKRAIQPGFDQCKLLPTMSKRKQPIFNRVKRTKCMGSSWFDLPATEVTEEMHNELKIIQMRSVLNPKQFYKKNDLKILPKFFQIGTVQHSVIDYHKEKKTRISHKTLVDELLENETFQNFNKRKCKEVNERNNKYTKLNTLKKKLKKIKK
ncbi:hypothetical protein KR067_001829 [Drosophila pandora]|nr:hypothetical protein KR067_001829 [Drosophila pandora]